jgi:hypothetical protein
MVVRYVQSFTWRLPAENFRLRPAGTDGLDEFQRSRATRRARGMKLLQVLVPDPRAPGFRDEAHRQALLLRGNREE